MARIRFLATNRWSASTATVTAESAALNLPASASQNPDRSYVWRSLTSNNASGSAPFTHSTLDIDLGSVQACAVVAIANPKVISGGGVIALYERGDGSSPGTATLVATLPAADPESRVAFATFASQSHRHWQLRWTNPTMATDYAEAGYVFLGSAFEPSVNFMVPSEGRVSDPSIPVSAVDGQTTVTARTEFKAGRLVFDNAATADFDSFRALYTALGVRRNFFVIEDDTETWSAMLIRFVSDLSYRREPVYGRYTVSVGYEEAR
jgi:hypothetical protein